MPRTLVVLAALALFGCNKPAADDSVAPAAPANPPPPAAGNQAAAPAQPHAHQSILEKMTTKIVDRQKALADNPRLVELEKNVFSATDPITYASKAYFSAVSQVQMAALKQTIDAHKILNDDKLPTFQEFETMLKQAGVKLQGLYRWQVYAYDPTTGEISILEDRDYKRSEYEKAGLEYKDQ